MKEFIPFALPDIRQEEIDEVIHTLKSGWITTGPKTKVFEDEFAKYVGCKYALAVNSATSGLHLALDAIGLKKGDKVITSPYTFTATAEVVRYFDADPIFCDVDENNYNICPDKLNEALADLCKNDNHNIKAIIPVHIAGLSCDMEKITEIAHRYHIKVIEDAAHAFPTTYNKKMIGLWSDITVYSFYANKTLSTAEGGMIVTNNESYKKRMGVMRLHGFDRAAWDRYSSNKPSWFYSVIAPGYKYNMTDINASIGIHQLSKIDEFLKRREYIAEYYNVELQDIKGIRLPPKAKPGDKHAYHLYMIQVPSNKRDKFIEEMALRGVGCSVHFIPLHLHPYWQEKYKFEKSDFPNAFKLFEGEVSIPIYTKLTNDQLKYIADTIKSVSRDLLC
jgi:dTDP-4-amino-4,6-dideoxygalactose transaminase